MPGDANGWRGASPLDLAAVRLQRHDDSAVVHGEPNRSADRIAVTTEGGEVEETVAPEFVKPLVSHRHTSR